MSNAAATALEQHDATGPDRLVTGPQLKDIYGIPYSREHLYRLALLGEFPSPLRLGGNRIAYRESEILAWINSRPRAVKIRRTGRRG